MYHLLRVLRFDAFFVGPLIVGQKKKKETTLSDPFAAPLPPLNVVLLRRRFSPARLCVATCTKFGLQTRHAVAVAPSTLKAGPPLARRFVAILDDRTPQRIASTMDSLTIRASSLV